MTESGSVTTWEIESVYGSSGEDSINADVPGGPILVDGNGGDDSITVGYNTPTDATVYGGTGSDSIAVLATNSALVYGDDNDVVGRRRRQRHHQRWQRADRNTVTMSRFTPKAATIR